MGCCLPKSSNTGDWDGDVKDAIEKRKKICVWVLGGPGCGKGTQCELLAAHFKLAHLSTGDLLRHAVETNTTRLGDEIREAMKNGDLIPTHTVLNLLIEAMESAYNHTNGYLIDGYPREVEQGELFCEVIGSPHVIIYLECPDEILKDRLLKRAQTSHREDDNEETIKHRLETFHAISQAVMKRWKSKVRNVDGTLSPLDVQKECVNVIENIEKDFHFT